MAKLRSLVRVLLLVALPYGLAQLEGLSDAPYILLTGFARQELEELALVSADELEARTGLSEVPGGLSGEKALAGRAAHAIASYYGTLRWGPNVTLAFGYLREYVPAILFGKEADPMDIAANYAGVSQALEELERAGR